MPLSSNRSDKRILNGFKNFVQRFICILNHFKINYIKINFKLFN